MVLALHEEGATRTAPEQNEISGKYLTFRLGSQEFGLDIRIVQEIMPLQTITPVAQSPAFIKGVVKLRGRIVPIIDLRLRLGIDAGGDTRKTSIVVIRTLRERGPVVAGLVIDEVVEVVDIPAEAIEFDREFATGEIDGFAAGSYMVKGGRVVLLDIGRVLGTSEIESLCVACRLAKESGEGIR